jgi:hypothetical protein
MEESNVSRPMLYATLCVLLAVLFGTSYALNRQTNPPKPEEPSAEQQAAKQKEMADKQKTMMEAEQKQRVAMMAKEKEKAKKEEKDLQAAAAANPTVKIKPKKTGVDISDKWFKETPDGAAGIEQAIKEKEALDKYNAEQAKKPVAKNQSDMKLSPMAEGK